MEEDRSGQGGLEQGLSAEQWRENASVKVQLERWGWRGGAWGRWFVGREAVWVVVHLWHGGGEPDGGSRGQSGAAWDAMGRGHCGNPSCRVLIPEDPSLLLDADHLPLHSSQMLVEYGTGKN